MIYAEIQPGFPPLFEAIGCVCVCEGQVLLLKRAEGKSYPAYWGLPSGKVEEDELPLHAAIRELFEETSILLTSENIKQINKYHVVREEFSFLYTVFAYQAKNFPNIKINLKEHTKYGWFSLDNALRLDLVPESDTCLRDVFSSLDLYPIQLDLFTGLPSINVAPTGILEQRAHIASLDFDTRNRAGSTKFFFVSLGSPSTGKTTVFKSMIRKNSNLKIICDNTILKRSSNLNYYLRKAFMEEERSFFFHFQMESLLLRFRYTYEAPNFSLVDESIYTTLAYSRALYRLGWLKEYEYQVFYNYYLVYFNLLPRPTGIFFLTCDKDSIKKRLVRRNRKHEVYYSDEYIDAMNFAFAEVALELASQYDFNVISMKSNELSGNEIAKRFIKVIERYEPTDSNQLI